MYKKHIFQIILSSLFLLAQGNQASKDRFEKATPQEAHVHTKLTIQEAALKAINNIRTHPQICSKGAPALRWSPHLYNMAKEHSIDMAVTGLLQHNGSATKTDVTAQRLKLNRGSFFYERVNQKANSKNLYSGELIVRTSLNTLASPKTVLAYWIKQPKNCQLLMNPNFTDFAMAKVISNKDHRAYWTLLLSGKRK